MTRALLLALALAAPASALDVPYLTGRVVDEAGMLSPQAKAEMTAKLKDLETRTGVQAVVLTMRSLEGEALEDFSLKVARTWKLGHKGQNAGVLLLISKEDRKLRIETGHGLEGSLTDAQCGRIISELIVPRFKAGDYEGGIKAGVDAVADAASGKDLPPPPEGLGPLRERIEREQEGFGADTLLERLLISAFVFGILGLFEFVGIVVPEPGWFLYFFLIPFWAAFPMAIWGPKIGMGCLLSHLILFPILRSLLPNTALGKKMRGGIRTSGGSGSGWSSGGGGWSSGGSSGGGFSGGGGSFGGGGSSGSW